MKDQILGFIRQALTFLGVYVAAEGFLPDTIIEQVIGGVMAVAVTAWGWIDKSNRDLSVWYSMTRHVLSAAGGLLLHFGIVGEELWNNIVSATLPIISILLSTIENKK